MISYILSHLIGYQIFRSIFFRSGMGYLTAYLLVSFLMPVLITKFRKYGFYSDFKNKIPIMGGILLILSALLAIFLWGFVWESPYIIAICAIMIGFGLIGFLDDLLKVNNRRSVELGKLQQKTFSSKADGLSEKLRLLLELGIAMIVLGIVFFVISRVDTRLQLPFVPIKNYFPELPLWIYYSLAVLLVVIGANAINMADGLDTMASIPMITCLAFIAIVAYISGDSEWSLRLKIPFLFDDVKEITVLSCIMIGSLTAFLKFNSPPASVYLGDIGSLGFGAAITIAFIFVKAEIFLSLAGGIFFITGLSSLIQRSYFKILLKLKGRDYAEKNRFFYRAPYHHHLQEILKKTEDAPNNIISLFDKLSKKYRIFSAHLFIEKPASIDAINSKIVWNNLIRAVFLLVIALIVFIKVR